MRCRRRLKEAPSARSRRLFHLVLDSACDITLASVFDGLSTSITFFDSDMGAYLDPASGLSIKR